MQRQRYHVVKHDEGWAVSKEGASRPSAVEPTKEKALERGIEIARNAGPSQILIHKENGIIQEERTYGGGDPYPPPGLARLLARGRLPTRVPSAA